MRDDYTVKRRPDMTFETTDPYVIEQARVAWAMGRSMRVYLPGWHGQVFVLEMTLSAPIDGLDKATITVRPTGAPLGRYNKMGEWKEEPAPHPMCRCTTKEEPVKELKKYYVGRPGVARSSWARNTLAEAIEHAKEILEKTGEEQVIVKVIRVVRRAPQPIIVEIV